MFTLKYSTLAAMAVVAILVADITSRFSTLVGVSNGSTVAIVAVNAFVALLLMVLGKKTKWKVTLPKSARLVFVALLVWSFIAFVRGALVAPDYWAWKALLTGHLFMFLVPLSIVIGLNANYYKRAYSAILFILFPVAFLLLPATMLIDSELFQRAALPVYMLLLLAPFLRRRWQLIVFAVAAISICMDFSYRVNVIRILVATLLASMFLLRIRLHPRVLNAAWFAAIAAPLLFLALGLSGRYNVFRDGITFEKSVAAVEGGQVHASALEADTRSFLYEEVLSSMQRRGSSFIAGQGAGTGYESAFFSRSIVGASGRGGSEVGFLNTLLYSGLIGVLLYAAMLFLAAYHAFNRSRNDLCKALGLFLLFKWALFFVEDIPKMDLNFFVTWTIIGLCLSNEFRNLDNAQVKDFFRRKRALISANGVRSAA